MDTDAAINIISENALGTLTWNSSVPVQLFPNDLNVVGVTGPNLQILGKVNLTVQLEEKACPFTTQIYVTTEFALPVDGLLGLETMK